jgi:hypothetical protein
LLNILWQSFDLKLLIEDVDDDEQHKCKSWLLEMIEYVIYALIVGGAAITDIHLAIKRTCDFHPKLFAALDRDFLKRSTPYVLKYLDEQYHLQRAHMAIFLLTAAALDQCQKVDVDADDYDVWHDLFSHSCECCDEAMLNRFRKRIMRGSYLRFHSLVGFGQHVHDAFTEFQFDHDTLNTDQLFDDGKVLCIDTGMSSDAHMSSRHYLDALSLIAASYQGRKKIEKVRGNLKEIADGENHRKTLEFDPETFFLICQTPKVFNYRMLFGNTVLFTELCEKLSINVAVATECFDGLIELFSEPSIKIINA